jgi:hypothetical protein
LLILMTFEFFVTFFVTFVASWRALDK